MGLSLYVGGTEAVEWTRPLIPHSGALTVRPGWNLVTWAGPDRLAVEDAFEPLGDIAGEAQSADGGAPTTLTRGSAFWLRASALKEWWQLDSPPVVIFKRGLADYEKAGLRRDVDKVVAWFGRRLGVGVPDLRIRFGHDRVECGEYASKTIYLNDPCFGSLAHEYVHALQHELARRNGRENTEPVWLTEGAAEYWSEQYRAWQYVLTYEHELENVIASRARSATAPLRRLWTYDALLAQTHGYALSQLAVDWLVNHAGEEALFTYYAQPGQSSWTSRFKSSFGLSPSEFYEEFEAYRAKVAPPIYRITGTFVDSSGRELPGISVRAHSIDGEAGGAGRGSLASAAFDVEVPQGSYLLSFSVGRCQVGWYGRDGRIVESREEAIAVWSSVRGTYLEVQLRRLCSTIQGTVRDAGYSGAAGIQVEAIPEGSRRARGTAITDEHGKFVLDVRDGTYLLSLSRDGEHLGWDGGIRLTLDRLEARRHTVDDQDVSHILRVTNLVVILSLPPPAGPPPAEFQGTIRDQSGSPVEGFQVTAHSLDGELIGLGTSDATGGFTFEVRGGTYVIAVGALACRLGWYDSDDGITASREDATPIQVLGGTTITVEVRLQGPSGELECGE